MVVSDNDGIWREWPSGKKAKFHNYFPHFDPEWGRPGDTLGYKRNDTLKVIRDNYELR